MPRSSNATAIAVMLLAVAVFAAMDAGLKLLVPFYPPLQLSALRGAASLPFVLAWVLPSTGIAGLVRVRWRLHLLRGLLGTAMMASFIFALDTMPLSTAYTIFFVGPILVAALSAPVLRERTSLRSWVAIVVGLAGVLVVLRPGAEGLFTGSALMMLVAASCYALSNLTVRVLSRTDSTQAMVLWLMVLLTAIATLASWSQWVPIRSDDWPVLLGIGVAGTIGQYAMTRAFSLGEPAVVAAFEYTALPWAVGLDLVVWQVLPDPITWVGAAIIVGSGLMLLRAER
ncbi:MAG: DMT family transporter [Deltaproteobacteria bacterium]|nr:DMT family transporter [Deltaproteobacteria bacterium]